MSAHSGSTRLPGRILSLFLLFLIAAPSASAQWGHFPYGVPITTAPRSQEHPEIISDGAGGAIIVWRDRRSTTDYDVYAQRIDANGFTQWTTDGVAVSVAVGDQQQPVLVSDGAGGALVTWIDERGGDYDVYAQRVDGLGQSQWTANGVVLCAAVEDQVFARIIADGAGGGVVVWTDQRGGSFSVEDVYAQKVNPSGVVQWATDGAPLSTAASRQHLTAAVASDGAGGVIAAWTDLRNGAGAWDLFAQRVDGLGVAQWTPDGNSISEEESNQYAAQSIPDGSGGVILVWLDQRNGPVDLYAQRLDASGVEQWTAGGIPLAVAPDNKFEARIIQDGSGGAFIAWRDHRNVDDKADIFIQHIDGDGVAQWAANGIRVSSAPDHQFDPDLILDGAGGVIITWADKRSGSDRHIYAQRLDASGAPQWILPGDDSDGVPVARTPNSTVRPRLVADGTGGAIITWHDARNGYYDIFAQRVGGDGIVAVREPLQSRSLVVQAMHPNPFSSRSTLRLAVDARTSVNIDFFDVAGRRVRSLSREDVLGEQSFVFDGRDNDGRALPNGIYFCRVKAAGETHTLKVGVLR